jgi:sugar O-acyltransferase (sialic acid O-acetyltransferase NeuD family)
MLTERVHLVGAGGHGRVVADALIAGGLDCDRLVPRDGRAGLSIRGISVIAPETAPDMAGEKFHIAVGSASIRTRLYERAMAERATPLTVVHPAAVVAADAVLGPGSFVAAGAIVSALARTGTAAIVNHGAVVDHDVVIGDFCHIAPNATLGGEVVIGDGVLIGSGAVVLPGVRIADGVVIGAGAVVVSDIGAPGTWVGNPARRLDD